MISQVKSLASQNKILEIRMQYIELLSWNMN